MSKNRVKYNSLANELLFTQNGTPNSKEFHEQNPDTMFDDMREGIPLSISSENDFEI